jgi:hypothetical protein
MAVSIRVKLSEFYDNSVKTNAIVIGTAFGAFILGIIITLVISGGGGGSGRTDVQAVYNTAFSSSSPSYMPANLMLFIAIGFTLGITYVMRNYVYIDDKDKSKAGVRILIGLCLGFFLISALLIPYAIYSARITIDSKYYLLASIITFYIAVLTAIIILYDKMTTIEDAQKLNLTTTHNIQTGLVIGLIAYGIFGILYV